MLGKGMLFFRRSNKIAEGWWNGHVDLVYGRYISQSLDSIFVGHLAKEYFEGESILEDRGKETIYIGHMKADKFEGFGVLHDSSKMTMGLYSAN
jgi:hypothetical protein